MTVDRRSRGGTRRAGDDQPGSLQRGGPARRPRRGRSRPTELHYVRSNFAVPAHDGTLEIGGAVENPTTLTLEDLRALPAHEHAVTLECAGNGRLDMRPLPTGEPWGDYAVSTARWKGALLQRRAGAGASRRPTASTSRFEGADHGAYHLQAVLPETSRAT